MGHEILEAILHSKVHIYWLANCLKLHDHQQNLCILHIISWLNYIVIVYDKLTDEKQLGVNFQNNVQFSLVALSNWLQALPS